MKNILVAEDEPNIALALQTIIKKGVKGSKIFVAENGMEALSLFQKNKIDLVLSDWNMPVMSGGELLSVIRSSENNSSVPFLMLTARADSESVRSAINGEVTEYIVKPFNKESLIEKVIVVLDGENKSGDSSRADEESVYKKITDLVNIRITKGYLNFPVLPEIGERAMGIVNNDDNSIEDVAALIKSDQSMAGKIMSVANSSFYRGQVPIETVESALTRIGLKEAGNIILALFLRELFVNEKGLFGKRLKALWLHSLTTAVVSKAIASFLGDTNKERIYAVALFHDIGKLMLIPVLKELKAANNEITEVVIDEVLSALHVQVGVDLLKHWDFSVFFINTIKHHHDSCDMSDIKTEVKIIMLADYLSKLMQTSVDALDFDEGVISTLSHDLRIDREAMKKIMSDSEDEVLQVKAFLNS